MTRAYTEVPLALAFSLKRSYLSGSTQTDRRFLFERYFFWDEYLSSGMSYSFPPLMILNTMAAPRAMQLTITMALYGCCHPFADARADVTPKAEKRIMFNSIDLCLPKW